MFSKLLCGWRLRVAVMVAVVTIISGTSASGAVVGGPTFNDIASLQSTADVSLGYVTETSGGWSGELTGLVKPTGEQFTFLGVFSIDNNLLSISGMLYDPNTGLEVVDPDLFGSLREPASDNGTHGLYAYLFQVTGGSLADQFGGMGATLGVTIDSQNQVGDVFATVPEPSSAIIFALLVLGPVLVGFRRLRGR